MHTSFNLSRTARDSISNPASCESALARLKLDHGHVSLKFAGQHVEDPNRIYEGLAISVRTLPA